MSLGEKRPKQMTPPFKDDARVAKVFSPNRILFVNDHIHFGGGGDAVLRLEREAYEAAGHEVFTFSQAHQVPDDATERDVVCLTSKNQVVGRGGKFLCAPGVSRSLKHLLDRIQPDLIRVHLVSKYPAAVYPALLGYPVIQTLHGPSLFCATSWGNLRRDSSACEMGTGVKCWRRGCVSFPAMLLHTLLDKRVRPWVKQVVQLYHCPSRQIQETAESLGFAPTIYIPLPIDEGFIQAEPSTHNGSTNILYVGALAEQKGLLFLPDALRLIKQQVTSVKLILCGSGPLEHHLKQEFALRGLTSSVDFRGFIEHDEIVELYRSAHVFVLPSIWNEQFGLVGPEALACGVPCVASNVGGIPEWLRDGEWGYLVPPRDSKALADRVTALLLDRDTRLRFGQKGRTYALAMHNPEFYKGCWLELVRKHARKHNASGVQAPSNHED